LSEKLLLGGKLWFKNAKYVAKNTHFRKNLWAKLNLSAPIIFFVGNLEYLSGSCNFLYRLVF